MRNQHILSHGTQFSVLMSRFSNICFLTTKSNKKFLTPVVAGTRSPTASSTTKPTPPLLLLLLFTLLPLGNLIDVAAVCKSAALPLPPLVRVAVRTSAGDAHFSWALCAVSSRDLLPPPPPVVKLVSGEDVLLLQLTAAVKWGFQVILEEKTKSTPLDHGIHGHRGGGGEKVVIPMYLSFDIFVHSYRP